MVKPLVSAGYKTNDIAHPIQEIRFGAEQIGSNAPYPVIQRVDASTGEILVDYVLTGQARGAFVSAQLEDISNEVMELSSAGIVQMFAGTTDTVPDGWLVCDGSRHKKDKYPELYAVIHGTYGENAEFFKVPALSNTDNTDNPSSLLYIISTGQ